MHHAASEVPPATPDMDWREISGQRLDRLVDLEHDYFLMRERLSALQTDYRELIVVSEGRQQRIRELERSMAALDDRLCALMCECEAMRASRSWRITEPLRALSVWRTEGKRAVRRGMRVVFDVPMLCRAGSLVTRLAPGLSRRVRSALYSHRDDG